MQLKKKEQKKLDKAKLKKPKMKCDECAEDIAGTYFQMEEKNICEKCYEVRGLHCIFYPIYCGYSYTPFRTYCMK